MTPISLYFECKRSRFRLTQDTYSTTRDFNFPNNLIGIHCLAFHELLILYIYIYIFTKPARRGCLHVLINRSCPYSYTSPITRFHYFVGR